MRRSFLRLVLTGVLIAWAVGFVAIVAYVRSRSWTEDRARADGVFLAHELLREVPAELREQRLAELRPNFSIGLALMAPDEVARRVGRTLGPGERLRIEVTASEEWYFQAFEDGEPALAAGPTDPAVPKGVVPIGVIFGIVAIPVLAGWLALQIEREVRKVERASRALAVGELGARVVDPRGTPSELAATFNAMAERVERLVRSRDELVQAISHELGSPLARLRFHVELLETASDESRAGRLTAMARELDALDELVAELLAYVQSGDEPLDRRVLGPEQGLRDLAELARLAVPGERQVEVEVDVPSDVRVDVDPRQFYRAVENVLRNAVRHAATRVRLAVVSRGERVHVEVHDDGCGIPVAIRDAVTKPFFRAEADRGRGTGGAGLGLAIVDRVVRRHDGTLTIGESPLGGALVTTSWPIPDRKP